MLCIKSIENLTAEEKNEINCLLLTCFEESRLNTYDTFVYYKEKNHIIGFIGLHKNKYKNENSEKYITVLNQICVEQPHRNQGIASYMLDMLSNTIYTNTMHILYVDKNKNTTEMLYNFYKKRGFEEIDNELIQTVNIPYNRDIEYLMIKQ